MPNKYRARVGSRHHDHLHGKALTSRELCVLYHIALGKDNDQIARAIYAAHGTVNNHIRAIYGKTGLHNRQQLVIFAVLARMVTRDDLLHALPDTDLPDLPTLGGDP